MSETYPSTPEGTREFLEDILIESGVDMKSPVPAIPLNAFVLVHGESHEEFLVTVTRLDKIITT